MRRKNRLEKGRDGPTSCWCDCPINCGSTCFWNVGMCGPGQHDFMESYCPNDMCNSGVDGCCNYYPVNCDYALTETLGGEDTSCGDANVPGDGSWWDCDEDGYCWGGMNCYEVCAQFLEQICGQVSEQFDLGNLPWSPNSEYGFYTWNGHATCGDASDGLINDFCSNNPEDEICGGCPGELDECGVCDGPGTVGSCDCDGYPIGPYCDCNYNNEVDDCGVCGGCMVDAVGNAVWGGEYICITNCCDGNPSCDCPSTAADPMGYPQGFFCDCNYNVYDCAGDCGGSDNTIPDGNCDCFGNVLDECGLCGGDGSWCDDDYYEFFELPDYVLPGFEECSEIQQGICAVNSPGDPMWDYYGCDNCVGTLQGRGNCVDVCIAPNIESPNGCFTFDGIEIPYCSRTGGNFKRGGRVNPRRMRHGGQTYQ